MRIATILVVLAALVAVSLAADHAAMFQDFKKTYNRQYSTGDEEAKRFALFAQNMRTAEKMAKLNPLAQFGVNAYSDLSPAEFKSRHNAEKFYARQAASSQNTPKVTMSEEAVARATGRAIDWRTKGAVTPIKNQGQCGSCWSFSATGSIEGQWFLAGNSLTSVSEQELVSCDTVDSGCNGGLMDNAWGWLISARGGQIVTEASYPYVSGDGEVPSCSLSGKVVGATINGHQDIAKDEGQMASWVYANGPLSVAVDATSWQTYNSGILTNCISNQIDHGVLVVGFNDNNSPPYWIVKNSWGTSWGESGYIRVQKGTDQCLITSLPCSSTVGKGPTVPPTPTGTFPPTPSGSGIQVQVCPDTSCASNCTLFSESSGCTAISSTSSIFRSCASNQLSVTSFSNSGSCTGAPSNFQVYAVGQCNTEAEGFSWQLVNCP